MSASGPSGPLVSFLFSVNLCHLNDNSYLVNAYIYCSYFFFENLYPYKAKMESQIIEFRVGVKFLTNEGTNAKEIHQSMADEYGGSSPKYSTVTGRKLHKQSRQLCIWRLKKSPKN